MNTTIRTGSLTAKDEYIAIFTTDASKFDRTLFSKTELDFIKSEIKKKSKLIGINQYKRHLLLHIVDTKDENDYKKAEAIRKAGDNITAALNRFKAPSVAVVTQMSGKELLYYLEGMLLGNYQFNKYKTDAETNALKTITIEPGIIPVSGINELTTVCEAVYMARDLVNEPWSGLNATDLAIAFRSMGKKSGFKVTVFDKAKINSMKMGGLLAVNKGSVDPPTFTVMEWKPAKPVNKKPYVLVGKGVVYDTGGLSLKPTANSMDYMKSDMAGAAAAGSIMYAVAKQRLPLHVIALVPATDNRPGGNAYTPGDVVTMYSGLKVEVLNTDAEGRMILADALHYAKQFNPGLVLEFSTLTGAAANAIGHYGIVCMGNCSDEIKNELAESGKSVYERLVEFPFWEEYDDLLKSDIADMKNIGGAVAGAITAGRFLHRFTDYPYMHFDIAGPSFSKSNDSYRGKNGSGVGVRFVFDYLKKKSGKS